jgi:hypothetical protein
MLGPTLRHVKPLDGVELGAGAGLAAGSAAFAAPYGIRRPAKNTKTTSHNMAADIENGMSLNTQPKRKNLRLLRRTLISRSSARAVRLQP